MRFACTAIIAALAIAIAGMSYAGGEETQDVEPDDRSFRLYAFEGGVIRLNEASGEASFCRLLTGSLVCRPAVENEFSTQQADSGLRRIETGLERIAASTKAAVFRFRDRVRALRDR